MHELGICRNIAAIISDAAQGRRVSRITLEIGKLSGVAVDAVRFSFGAVVAGTSLEGAILDIKETEGRVRCVGCDGEFAVSSLYGICACGCRRLRPLAGEELNIKSMELEAV